MGNKRNILTITTLSAICLSLMLIGATYAFLIRIWNEADVDVPLQVTTNTIDSLFLSVDADISILATPDNYDVGMKTDMQTSTATAMLQANNKTNEYVRHYYVYFDILENNFEYTTSDEQPELLLHIVDPEGNEVTDLNGLEHKTIVDSKGDTLTGFDITLWHDIITIANYYEIATDTKKTDNWEISVAFVNLQTPQKENTGKEFTAKIIMQKEPKPITDLCGNVGFGRCLADNYKSVSNFYLHDESLTNGAKDNNYRFSGSYENVNNYVCFGDLDENENCPHDKLYRIIGVFNNQVKLIKADYAKSTELGTNYAYKSAYGTITGTNKGTNSNTDIGAYYWSTSNNNNWNNSTLNTQNLNTTFKNTFSTEWQEKIANHMWKTAGNTTPTIWIVAPPTVYQNEIVNPSATTTYTNKFGLMYISDYMYGATPEYWTYKGYGTPGYEAAVDDNWLYGGLNEWIITRASNYSNQSFGVFFSGYIHVPTVNTNPCAVRPCFYLNADVEKVSGSGKLSDPFILKNEIEQETT